MQSYTDGVSLLQAFTERAQAVAAQVSHVAGIEEAADVITATDVPTTSGRHTATSGLLSAYPSLRDALLSRGIELRVAEEIAADHDTYSRAAAALQGDVGIVLASWGVAETGSFLSVEETLPARLLGMLADSVLVLLPAEKIVTGLDEAGALLSQLQSEGRRYVSLVTGPSRTADIERVLTIGVQGPKVLHMLVLT